MLPRADNKGILRCLWVLAACVLLAAAGPLAAQDGSGSDISGDMLRSAGDPPPPPPVISAEEDDAPAEAPADPPQDAPDAEPEDSPDAPPETTPAQPQPDQADATADPAAGEVEEQPESMQPSRPPTPAATADLPEVPETMPPAAVRAAELWEDMRRADVNSEEFATSRHDLMALVTELPKDRKLPVAMALMDRRGDEAINIAALQLFGKDGLAVEGIAELLRNPVRYQDTRNRHWRQRLVVLAYYSFCRPDYEAMLSEESRRGLVRALAEHLRTLGQMRSVPYGEQRLLSQVLQDVLSRYAGRQELVPAMADLLDAMQAYNIRQRQGDALAVAISAWLGMNATAKPDIDSVESALVNLGYWDPMVRAKAVAYLGSAVRRNPAVGDRVMQQLQDPRDEVRAAAARVFSFATGYDSAKVIERMVSLLVWDRSVVVQKAASETLTVRADEAERSLPLLLKALRDRSPRAGPSRTSSILQALGFLVNLNTPRDQKQQLLDLAVENLPYAPEGSLRALEALGAFARPAVARIRQFRDNRADRFLRHYINRHVLSAIDPMGTEG